MMKTALGKTGLQDWILQRISAVILAVYCFFLLGYLLRHHPLHYHAWQALFVHGGMRFFSLCTLFSLLLHAWIGLWTMSTDYIKSIFMRGFFQISVLVVLLGYFLWGFTIIWGVR